MRKDLALRPVDFTSSFLSCEKDLETILRRLFVESQPYSNDLKRLLVINTKDCLDNKTSEVYQNAIKDMSLAKLRENGYIKFEPKIKMPEHEEVKSYLIFSFDMLPIIIESNKDASIISNTSPIISVGPANNGSI